MPRPCATPGPHPIGPWPLAGAVLSRAPGEALRLFLPPEARRQEQSTQARADALRLTAEGIALVKALSANQVSPDLSRAPAQQAALKTLGSGPQRRAELLAEGHSAPT